MYNAKGMSPILRHALESFEHGIFHYLDDTETSRKFALLHIDHSIELILKEKVIRLGQSIFKKDGKTIGVYEAYSILENNRVLISEKPRLEDLHDFRNIVQHKGLTPDENTVGFYVTEAYKFVKRFLHDEMEIELDTCLPRPYKRAMEGLDTEKSIFADEVKRRLLDSEKLFSSGAYEMAVISAFTSLEIAIRNRFKDSKPSPLVNLFRQLVDEGKIDENDWASFKRVIMLRNKAAHTGGGISREQARQALNDLNAIVDILPS
jgi:uncharacterized protein YutE (UPF0331/DUF86 family)